MQIKISVLQIALIIAHIHQHMHITEINPYPANVENMASS